MFYDLELFMLVSQIMNVTEVNIESVKPYNKNPRINDDAVQVVKKSLKEFGFQQPLVLDQDNVVIVGHTRLLAATELGLKKVPCVIANNLDKEKIKAYRIMDNKSAEYASWNYGLLTEEMNDLLQKDYDLSLTGFNLDELNNLGINADFDQFAELGLTDEDEVPELQHDPISKKGDIWILGNHKLMNGDSTNFEDVDKLMGKKKADLIFTDPPYGIDFSGGRTQTVAKKDYGKIMNDNLSSSDTGDLIQNIWSFHKEEADIYICVSPKNQKPFLDAIEKSGNKVDHVIVWDKKYIGLGYMSIRRQCEFILMINNKPFKKGDISENDLWSYSRDKLQEYQHGTQKPVALSERAISHSSKKMDIVLDLFGGSGSTLLACEKTKRKARIMELDPMFVDVTIQRYQNYTGIDAINLQTNETYKNLQKNTING